VLILDNCNIHHAEEVRELVEDAAGSYRFFLYGCPFLIAEKDAKFYSFLPIPLISTLSSKHLQPSKLFCVEIGRINHFLS